MLGPPELPLDELELLLDDELDELPELPPELPLSPPDEELLDEDEPELEDEELPPKLLEPPELAPPDEDDEELEDELLGLLVLWLKIDGNEEHKFSPLINRSLRLLPAGPQVAAEMHGA